MDALTTTGSVLGMVLGTAGLSISLLNYLRDRPRVKVTLSWNMMDPRTQDVRGLVRVTNTGRRAVFIGVAAIEIPNSPTVYVLNDSLAGTKLAEGDKPAGYFISHDGMAEHAAYWRKVRAFVEVSTGEKYYSPYPKEDTPPPKWALPRD